MRVRVPSWIVTLSNSSKDHPRNYTRREHEQPGEFRQGLLFSDQNSYTARMSEPELRANQPPQPTKSDLFDPYEKLITIEVLGKQVEVPEKNRLLRCFQYLSMKTISYGDFCWNGDCTNCQVWYHTGGQTEAGDRPALSCRLEASPGMVITRLNQFIVLEGINK